ncbi:MAG: hypothetical protein WBB74_03430 [Gaiellaceae bacterium]
MSSCCAQGYSKVFGERQARRDARRFRRKGLDGTGQRIVDELTARGIDGASLLEVGGGVGAIDIELLHAGADRAQIVELSHGYDVEAEKLTAEAGFQGRVERLVADFAETEADIDPADVVVMHRVVCCYPDPEALVGAATRHARRLLALTFPKDRWWTRLGFWVGNLWYRNVHGFEAYIHPPATILGVARSSGLQPIHEHTGLFWQLAVFERNS